MYKEKGTGKSKEEARERAEEALKERLWREVWKDNVELIVVREVVLVVGESVEVEIEV